MDAAIAAKNRLERIIVGDTGPAWNFTDNAAAVSKAPRGFTTLTAADTDFLVDDILVSITGGFPSAIPDDPPALDPKPGAQNPPGAVRYTPNWFFAFSGRAIAVAQTERFGPPEVGLFRRGKIYLADNILDRVDPDVLENVILHELLHVAGLNSNFAQNEVNFADAVMLENPKYNESKPGEQWFSYWNGTIATKLWKEEYDCEIGVPLEDLGVSGLHLYLPCIPDTMFNRCQTKESVVTDITAAMLQDIGHVVDYNEVGHYDKSDLGDGCGSFCKKSKRRLQGRTTPRKGTPKNGGRRLNPLPNIPAFVEETVEEAKSSRYTPDKPEVDQFMLGIHEWHIASEAAKEAGIEVDVDTGSISVLFLAPDGSFYGLETTFAEADKYVKQNGLGAENANANANV